MAYHFLDDISSADVGFAVSAASLAQVFIDSAAAVTAVMVRNPAAIQPAKTIPVHVVEADLPMLLWSFLQELVYRRDAEGFVVASVEITLSVSGQTHCATAKLHGECFDPDRHQQGTDVKAVTFFRLDLYQANNQWHSCVVLDV